MKKTPNRIEASIFRATRLLTLIAVAASLAGALLMFMLGAEETFTAFNQQYFTNTDLVEGLSEDEATVISLMVALDRFLIGVVLLFFAYGVYGLFVRPDLSSRELGLPDWMHVDQIGQLKQTLAEVIIVVLFVLFLRIALQTFHGGGMSMSLIGIGRFLMLPFAILLLAAALRLVELHPKPVRSAALPTQQDGENGQAARTGNDPANASN